MGDLRATGHGPKSGRIDVRQLCLSLGNGNIEIVELPYPTVGPRQVLVRTSSSLLSAGTERMLLDFGRSSLLDKIRQQPERVRDVLQKLRTDGFIATFDAVNAKLEQPIPLGYCNVGRVLELGSAVAGLSKGDRVVSNGPHAEIVRVAATLCARVPDTVSDEGASFAVLGAIALQGVRLAAPTIGETFAVFGLGLIGQITCQLLVANGCRVLGLDIDAGRLALAETVGIECLDISNNPDPVRWALGRTDGRGVDGVLVAASTTSDAPVRQAARMSRKRGRIVLVGVAGLQLSRADFYEKELSFQVSCSYGPGRYDREYEEEGHDYPLGFVRWTAQRNFEAFLNLLGTGRLNVDKLVSHRVPFERCADAYRLLDADPRALGIVLEYAGDPSGSASHRSVRVSSPRSSGSPGAQGVGFIGSGNYAVRILAPAFSRAGADLRVLANTGSLPGAFAARKFGFGRLTTDLESLFGDPQLDALVIATRHDSHATLALRALESGKHVFVEKPLCLSLDELALFEQRLNSPEPHPVLCVGFNRRYSPIGQQIRSLLQSVQGPVCMTYTVNAGAIPADHWTQRGDSGGGRIVGECCHFIDFLRFLVGHPIVGIELAVMRTSSMPRDTVAFLLSFADGSVGCVHYVSNGSSRVPKERLEVSAAGRTLRMENFRSLSGYGWGAAGQRRLLRPDKGQLALAKAFLGSIRDAVPPPIPLREILEVSHFSVLAQRMADA